MADLFGPEPATIWDVVRHWVGRPMLTKLLKAHGKDALKEAALKTLLDEAVEQRPYFLACLKEAPVNGTVQVWQLSNDDLMALAVDRDVPTRGKSRKQLINALR